MMWQATSSVDLAAGAATPEGAGMPSGVRRVAKLGSWGVSWRKG
jgi:hypothetical protein